jgi:hypothetical protein
MNKIWKVGFALMTTALIVLATVTVQAAPFVVVDPYPLEANLADTDPPNPESFIVVFDTGAPVVVPPSYMPAPDGRLFMKYDLMSVSKGKHVVKVKASHSIWGESVDVPFTFRGGTPNAPTGVGLQK